MSKKSKKRNANQTKKLSITEESLEKGIQLHKKNPLFSQLGGKIYYSSKRTMGKDCAAVVHSNGEIYLNKDMYLSPPQWSYVIAHCQLHLAFGHFDMDKMPGYEISNSDGSKAKKVSCNIFLWNIACDIYITKFLYDIKYGEPICDNPVTLFPGNLTDEIKIYNYLIENNYSESEQKYGTGTITDLDMVGLENPIVYDKTVNETNKFAVDFAYALANSVSDAVSIAGGHEKISSKSYTASSKAANWFINHYPLLGGLASAFKIMEDYNYCIQQEIQIAAVNVTLGEIYINPAASLKEEELKFVLAHEFLHAGLQHHERCRGRDHYLWNVACDYVINGWLHEMQIGQMPEAGLYDESLKNMSAESIYDKMITDLKKFSKLNTLRGYHQGDIIESGKPNSDFPYAKKKTGMTLDDFYKNALMQGLEYHKSSSRGLIPAGLIEEIRALAMPPIPWDVELAKWFDCYFIPLEKRRTYARPSRRQGATLDIPRPSYITNETLMDGRTFGVVIDTSGSMSTKLLGMALGSIASYAVSKEIPFVRVIFCDAAAYDAGYLTPEDVAGRVEVKGRGGTRLQPGINLLESAKDFPKAGPILIITDGEIEERLSIHHEHAFLIPKGHRLPFRSKGQIFYL